MTKKSTAGAISSECLLTEVQVAERLSVTKRTVAHWRYSGAGPKFVKLGAKMVRYRAEDIESWIESGLRTRTDDVA